MMRDDSKAVRDIATRQHIGREGGKQRAELGLFRSIEERNQAMIDYWHTAANIARKKLPSDRRLSQGAIAAEVKDYLNEERSIHLSAETIRRIYREREA